MRPFLMIVLLLIEVIFLIGFIFIFVSGFVSVIFGAPYVPIERRLIRSLLSFGSLGSQDTLFDMGSGDGRVLIAASKDFHIRAGQGYEIAPWPYWKSRWKTRHFKNLQIFNQSFFEADISKATCVYAYLYPNIMPKLAGKIAAELSSGARVICPAFEIDTAKHPQLKLIKTEKIGRLTAYLYQKI